MDSVFSIGGVQRVTAVIAKELAKEYDVTIVTFDNPYRQDTSLYGLGEADIHFRFFRYPSIGRLQEKLYKVYSGLYLKLCPKYKWCSDLYALSSFPAKRRKALLQELLQGGYDAIIGVHAPLAARLATLRGRLPNVRLIGWIHNSFEALFSDTSLYIGADRKRYYVYQFMKLNETVVLCRHDAETYHAYDASFTPTAIYNPLTLKPGRAAAGTSKRFLAVGRFSRLHKGFDLLIEAFNLFALTDSEWVLDIVGEGEEEGLYRNMIKNYHLENRVFIHPFTNNIQQYYSQSQIYVLSSRWEGFGLVLVEAMAHGLPVVSSDLPTSQEIMGDFGLYFKNGDVRQLAQRLTDATQIDWAVKSLQAMEIARRFNLSYIIAQWKHTLGL